MSGLDPEEDYEATYPDGGYREDPYGNLVIPVGRCNRMCPLAEMQMRESHNRLNKYETETEDVPARVDFNLAIKEFKRSCEATLDDLRPWSVLKKTLHHLLLTICFQDDDWMFICDFVFDRLKALRQDMIIQRIEGRRYIEVLEGSVRFLVFSQYKLSCTLKDYCHETPMKQVISLVGPVKGLNNYELNVIREIKLTTKCLRDCLNSLIIQYQEKVPDSPNRPLFEALNLIVNLPFLHGYSINSTEFQAKSELRNSNKMFKIVFKIYREHLSGNHWRAMNQLPKLTDYPLLILAYAPVLAQLQAHQYPFYKKLYSATGSSTSSAKHLGSLICPRWLDPDEDERTLFAKFFALQFGFYDEERNLCDYKMDMSKVVQMPRDFAEKAELEQRKMWNAIDSSSEGENETRIYALQMILGKDWNFFKEILNMHGAEQVLSPTTLSG